MVSFNLNPSAGDAQSTDGDGESDNDGHIYLPMNVRSIEETFDAWHESFKRPESRTSLLSSGGGNSPYQLGPRILEEEDESLETRSSSSCFSAQESDITAVSNNARPASRLSFVSDNSEKTLSPEPRSRVSSASSRSVVLETGSQTGSLQVDSNVGEQESEKSGDLHAADEMTRSLSSALSFITEHGQVRGNTPSLEKFDGEVRLAEPEDLASKDGIDLEENGSYASKVESVVVSEGISEQDVLLSREVAEESISIAGKKESVVESGGIAEREDLLSREEVGGDLTNTNKTESIVESELVGINRSIIESAVNDLDVSDTGMSEEPVLSVSEIRVDENDERIRDLSDEGKVPSINVEILCTDGQAADTGFSVSGASVDSAESVSKEASESVPCEELNEDLSERTEDFSNAEERFSLLDAVFYSRSKEDVVSQGEEKQENKALQEEEVKPSGSDEEECLHCKNSANRKNASLIEAVEETPKEDGSFNDEDSKQSKLIDLSSETGDTVSFDEHSVQKSAEIQSITEESENLGLSKSTEQDHDAELKNETSTLPNREDGNNEQEAADKDNESEISQGNKETNDDDDEGGYTTEASATTLQGIRGVIGKRQRCSTAATSVAFDVGDAESAFSEDGSGIDDKPYDLATKEGFDAFKEFLLETSGEKLLQFWLEVECGRYLERDDERSR